MPLRPAVEQILRELLARTEESRTLTLDSVSSALGTLAVSADEVEALFTELEGHGRVVVDAHETRSISQDLATVLSAVRHLAAKNGTTPTLFEIAEQTGLSVDTVAGALRFAAVMGR